MIITIGSKTVNSPSVLIVRPTPYWYWRVVTPSSRPIVTQPCDVQPGK